MLYYEYFFLLQFGLLEELNKTTQEILKSIKPITLDPSINFFIKASNVPTVVTKISIIKCYILTVFQKNSLLR